MKKNKARVLYTLDGKCHPRLRLGFHSPPRVYKTPWTPVTACNNCIMKKDKAAEASGIMKTDKRDGALTVSQGVVGKHYIRRVQDKILSSMTV